MVRWYRVFNLVLEDFLALMVIVCVLNELSRMIFVGKYILGEGNSLCKVRELREKLVCLRICKSLVCWFYWE